MKHCMECGAKLELKYLEKEGMIPYCPICRAFRFPVFNTAVSMIVMNPSQDKILLIQQYGRKDYILVAGYVNKGECAEDAVVREVKEEIGLTVSDLHFNKSLYYEKSNTLLLNFSCTANSDSLEGMTDEVDLATWFSFEEARTNIRHGGPAHIFLEHFLEHL